MFSLSGMAAAAIGATNKEKAKEAAGRIFALIDQKSKIDPLSSTGKKGIWQLFFYNPQAMCALLSAFIGIPRQTYEYWFVVLQCIR